MTATLVATSLALSACRPGIDGVGERPAPEPTASASSTADSQAPTTLLPAPGLPTGGDAALPDLLDSCHSTREFAETTLTLEEVSALLWSGYGVQSDGGRTVPSAGALYPLDIRVVAGTVDGLEAGVHAYRPGSHSLEMVGEGDVRAELAGAALGQESVALAPAVLVVVGAPDRVRERYGTRAERFTLLEAGHVGQNLALAAQSVGLGLVLIGSFDDAAVARILDLEEGEQVYYLVPVGHPL
ncbi:MAG: SagB/ThcOx family dehydrogenase [Propionibacterium sp.]|nr:SagB/ThcOx family dehydrogenase [Propionibacterium sp.]